MPNGTPMQKHPANTPPAVSQLNKLSIWASIVITACSTRIFPVHIVIILDKLIMLPTIVQVTAVFNNSLSLMIFSLISV